MPPHVHRCNRRYADDTECGAFAIRGFGPGDGQRGETRWACSKHVAIADEWHRVTYRRPVQAHDVPVERSPQAVSGGASGTGDLFGG